MVLKKTMKTEQFDMADIVKDMVDVVRPHLARVRDQAASQDVCQPGKPKDGFLGKFFRVKFARRIYFCFL